MYEPAREDIERINQLSLIARTAWFGLLAYLAFVGVTLLSVEDADFFVPSRQTHLPLVNVAIPTASFFWLAPLLGAALYAYLHLQLLKLWKALCSAEPRPGGKSLSDQIYPWLISDFALWLRGAWRDDGSLSPHHLRWLSALVTFFLVWISAPAILCGFWFRSWPAHEGWMTQFNGLCFLTAVVIGVTSAWALWQWLPEDAPEHVPLWKQSSVRMALGCLALLVLLLGDVRSAGWTTGDFWLARIKLQGVNFVQRPPEWRRFQTVRQRFRAEWCLHHGIAADICWPGLTHVNSIYSGVRKKRNNWCELQDIDRNSCDKYFEKIGSDFYNDWHEQWENIISSIKVVRLKNRDFRRAKLFGAFLPGADLKRANFERAYLTGANMEGAKMYLANLRGANLRDTQLNRAVLRGANLKGANLMNASLEEADIETANFDETILKGANLKSALMKGVSFQNADLRHASVTYSILEEANLAGADLRYVQFEEADLFRSDLSGAKLTKGALNASHVGSATLLTDSLTQDMLDHAFGDSKTLIPDTLMRPCHWHRSNAGDPFRAALNAWFKARAPRGAPHSPLPGERCGWTLQ